MRDYRGRYPYELPPHIYAIAESAFRGITTDGKSQAIIITGESGAGKTEASKHIMSYLASISGLSTQKKVRSRSLVKRREDTMIRTSRQLEQQHRDLVKNQILKSNPLLEAFGNAKTVRNNNSSRFGKYMEIFFTPGGAIIGGKVTQFLLEKSRVISQSLGERNFHIFYQLFTDKTLKKTLMLDTPNSYNYLNKSKCTEVPDIDDAKEFVETKNAMTAMGISKKDQDRLFELLAAILHLGNIGFTPTGDGCRVSNVDVLQLVAKFFYIEPKKLETALITKTVEAGGRKSLYMSPLRVEEAIYVRDALAKSLYSLIFDYIVALVNASIDSMQHGTESKNPKTNLSIGILDIYGFEIFENNSFEQLCINYVNERLQKTFIELTLELEQKEYAAEGIKWEKIPYIDNSPCLQAVDAKMGIFSLLNEACLVKKNDMQFLESLKQNIRNPSMLFKDTDIQKGLFTVKHYAGDVIYSVTDFVQKNTDSMFQSLVTMMSTSTCPTIKGLFAQSSANAGEDSTPQPPAAQRGVNKTVSKRPPMIATQFKKQVDELIDKLYQCNTHYVRCMKPNTEKRSDLFTDEMMLHQIRYLGLLENIRVRRAGFVYRHLYPTFVHHYGVILLNDKTFTKELRTHNPREAALKIVKYLLGNQMETNAGKLLYAMGKTKVFIRTPELVFSLEEMRERALPDYAIKIQRLFRRFYAKKFYIDLRTEIRDLMQSINKKRRRISYNRTLLGDYLNLQYNESVNKLLDKQKDNGKILLSAIVNKMNKRNKVQQRALLITSNAIYTLGYKQRKTVVNYSMKRKILLSEVKSITLSPHTDNYFVVECLKKDYVFESDDKTEIVGILHKAAKESGNQNLTVQTQERFQFKVSRSDTRTFTFVQSVNNNNPTHVQTAKGQVTVFVRDEPDRKLGVNYRYI